MNRILVVSNRVEIFESYIQELKSKCIVDTFGNIYSGFESHQRRPYDYCFLEASLLNYENFPGAGSYDELLKSFTKLNPASKIIILAHDKDTDLAVQLVELGANSYLNFPVNPSELDFLIESLNKSERKTAELNYLRNKDRTKHSDFIHNFRNKAMSDLLQKASDVGKTRSTVLITGETGVGKGVLAKLIHENSSRSSNQFIHVHCGAISENLVESELFGHEKGSFTGAINRKLGKFELSNKGTIFLDEVSTLTPSAQIKLLQVLQDSKFQRVGGESDVIVDIRVIAATNEDLFELCNEGKFRKDLYYRLNVFPLHIPPLKERTDDILPIIEGYLTKLNALYSKNIKGIQADALAGLIKYNWPGNIRELENLVERAYIIEKTSLLSSESFPLEIFEKDNTKAVLPLNTALPLPEARLRMVENFERQYLIEILSQTNGKVSQAANHSGVGVRQFNKLMSKYGIKKEHYKSLDYEIKSGQREAGKTFRMR